MVGCKDCPEEKNSNNQEMIESEGERSERGGYMCIQCKCTPMQNW